MPSKLDQLRAMTVVVADTGDLDAVRRLKPQDCTTNPTLLLKAAETARLCADLVEEALGWGRRQGGSREAVAAAVCDRLAVAFGTELAGIVPGRVSTEVDADLSFDTQATDREGARDHRRLRGARRRARADPDQDRLDLGGHPGRGGAAARGHRLQPHAPVLAGPGGRLRRCRRLPDLALRRPHPRLARQGRRRSLHRRDRSRRRSRSGASTTITRRTASAPW